MLALTLLCSLHLSAVVPPPLAAVAVTQSPSTPAPQPSPAPREERHKSFNPLIGLLELTVGAAAAYVGVLVGVLYNIGQGGAQWPPDAGDILLLGALPAVMAAGGSWLIGLMDSSQRSVLGSLLHALLGAAVGQAAGLGVGYLIGRAAAGPDDLSGAMSIAVFIAPAFAALGSTLFMELFKPGEVTVSGSLAPVRDGNGAVSLAPAVSVTW
jgi:hypothetical protein